MGHLDATTDRDLIEAVEEIASVIREQATDRDLINAVEEIASVIREQDLASEIEELRNRVSGIAAGVRSLWLPLFVIAAALFWIAAKQYGAPWKFW